MLTSQSSSQSDSSSPDLAGTVCGFRSKDHDATMWVVWARASVGTLQRAGLPTSSDRPLPSGLPDTHSHRPPQHLLNKQTFARKLGYPRKLSYRSIEYGHSYTASLQLYRNTLSYQDTISFAYICRYSCHRRSAAPSSRHDEVIVGNHSCWPGARSCGTSRTVYTQA
jgi:hypothetical protein